MTTSKNPAKDTPMTKFFRFLEPDIAANSEPTAAVIIAEYGSVFVASGGAVPPDRVIFADEDDVARFQSGLSARRESIGGFELELQEPAMGALLMAREEAELSGLSITPRGPDSARRDYRQTVELWTSRVEPALNHWMSEGRLSHSEADELRSLEPFDQVAKVFEYEARGIYFAKSLDKPIMYSVAPPGTSQHLALLALDIAEFNDADARRILAKHGWFQTVISDLPHFTYLGMKEEELPNRGLRRIDDDDGRVFWVPDI